MSKIDFGTNPQFTAATNAQRTALREAIGALSVEGGNVSGNITLPNASFGANNALTGAVGDARYGGQTVYYWPTNEIIVNNATTGTTYVDALVIPLPASSVLEIDMFIVAGGTANSGAKVRGLRDSPVAWASGGTATWGVQITRGISNAGAVFFNAASGAGVNVSLSEATSSTAAEAALRISGIVETISSGNTFRLQFAQNTAHADNTTCRRGTFARVKNITGLNAA